MDEYEEATARLRVAWATHYTADFESGPGDYHYEHCDFSELDRLLAARDRVVAANAWDELAEHAHQQRIIGAVDRDALKASNPYRITEED